ncbi:pentatricopeptide repeat protein [Artemisia annua]|uniref:Pentatricopeptide repeat protein n=1 Tax=Artemisia annua TaxID=35608 RepID=A0A2U1MNV0_ARTAN|nr:pentatricopeptide repeat protein [Artemisia annua]
MISGLCREGLVGDAKDLFHKMAESDFPPDNVTYRVLLQGYLKNQYYDDLEILMHDMDGRRYSLDATTLSLSAVLIGELEEFKLKRQCLGRTPSGQEKFVDISDLQGWGYSCSDIQEYLAARSIVQGFFSPEVGVWKVSRIS